jgi:hypothetical protein
LAKNRELLLVIPARNMAKNFKGLDSARRIVKGGLASLINC